MQGKGCHTGRGSLTRLRRERWEFGETEHSRIGEQSGKESNEEKELQNFAWHSLGRPTMGFQYLLQNKIGLEILILS